MMNDTKTHMSNHKIYAHVAQCTFVPMHFINVNKIGSPNYVIGLAYYLSMNSYCTQL